ncbi:Amino-acid permease inda1 [Rhodotorula toruloides]
MVIYVLALLIVCVNFPSTYERLPCGGSGPGTSPRLNLTICLSILSIGIASVFAGSRVLTGLAATGLAPRIFAYVDESSRPLFSFISVLMFGSFVNLAPNAMGDKVFNAVWPLGRQPASAGERGQGFFLAYLAAILFFRLCGYLKTRTLPYRTHDIDPDVGLLFFFAAAKTDIASTY